ncbi:hypothetical protein EV201_0368 [Ancylomarina subtilis]|uniref:Uncharacterized protein n=1 Tax=Ancylomarina subtilis TaxID=1639035 RepID=A0A4Q7VI11_9BACT|nr:hypothetical protein EV201_0368 [Ancylomarina subtilis]
MGNDEKMTYDKEKYKIWDWKSPGIIQNVTYGE